MYKRYNTPGLSSGSFEKLAKYLISQSAENVLQDLDISLANVQNELGNAEWQPLEGSGNRMVRSVSLGYAGGLDEQSLHELFWKAQEMGFDMRIEDDGELVAFEIMEDPSKFVMI